MLRRNATNTIAVLPLLLVSAGALPFAPAFAGGSVGAVDALKKAIKAEGRVSYIATVQFVIPGERGAMVLDVQRVTRGPDNCKRIETIAPRHRAGRLIVSDGKTRWEYRPRTHVVREEKVQALAEAERQQLEQLDFVKSLAKITLLGEDTVAGRKCQVIGVQPGGSSRVRKKVWVDVATHVQLRLEIYNETGGLCTQWLVNDIDYSYTPTAPDFRFAPPKGAKVEPVLGDTKMPLEQAERTIGFEARLPGYVPAGYGMNKNQVGIARRSGQAALWFLYVNGVDRFSLFQSRKLRKRPGAFRGALYWESGGFSFLLVGDLSDAEKAKVKNSLQD